MKTFKRSPWSVLLAGMILAALALPASAAVRTVKAAGGAQYTSIADAVSAAQDGDIIEIQDSATYHGRLQPQAGVNNLTIQAVPNQAPVLENITTPDAGLDWSGTGTLLVKGLVIQSGWAAEVRENGTLSLFRSVLYCNNTIAIRMDKAGHLNIEESLVVGDGNDRTIYFGGAGTVDIKKSTIANTHSNGNRMFDADTATGTATDSIFVHLDNAYDNWVFIGPNVELTNCDLYGNPAGPYIQAKSETNCVHVNPALTGTTMPPTFGSFALPSGSALLTASTTGGPIGWGGVTVPVELSGFSAE